MFEGSLVESRGLPLSQTQRWAALGSLTVQCAVAALLLALPLLRPQVLPMLTEAPQIALPFVSRPPVVPLRTAAVAASSSAVSAPASEPVQAAASRPLIFQHGGELADGPVPAIGTNLRMGDGTGLFSALSTGGSGPAGPGVVAMRPREAGPVHVSTGVLEGLLLTPIQPVYPAIARIAGVQGAVVLQATISKAGRIESLHVVSGSPMLQRAAIDAVQVARYRPYMLNGEAVEVQTTITVVFQLRS